jgi:hypothetical protein
MHFWVSRQLHCQLHTAFLMPLCWQACLAPVPAFALPAVLLPSTTCLVRWAGTPCTSCAATLDCCLSLVALQGRFFKCHFFSSFFLNKLYKDNGYNYKDVSTRHALSTDSVCVHPGPVG